MLFRSHIDPVYRRLVGEVLESVRPGVEAVDPGMCHRGGWIFITSPNTVTPFHFDKEHNFVLQIHGRTRIYVWDHRDNVVESEHSRSHERRVGTESVSTCRSRWAPSD